MTTRYALLLFFSCACSLYAETWTKDGDGTWNTAANWTPNTVPNATDATASFSDEHITGDITVTIDVAITVGTLDLDSENAVTLASPSFSLTTLKSAGEASLNVSKGSHTISSPIGLDIFSGILEEALVVNVASSSSVTLSGVISDISAEGPQVLGVAKQGAGTLILTNGSSTYGGLIIFNGTAQVSTAGALGTPSDNIALSMGGGTFQVSESFSLTDQVFLGSGDGDIDTNGKNLVFSGLVHGSGKLIKKGEGLLTLSDAMNSYGGGTVINGGTLSIAVDGNLGDASGSVTLGDGATLLSTAGTLTTSRSFILAGAGSIRTSNSLTLSGNISNASSSTSGSLTKVGGGTLTLSGTNNTYSGGTILSAGTLSVDADSRLGAASGSLTIGEATFVVTADVSSARTVNLTGEATMDTGANTLTFSGGITGSGALKKESSGTLVLSGSNNYSGGTRINGGTLLGNSSSLQGGIFINSGTLRFDQSSNGTYSGVLTGTGAFVKQGVGILEISGSSPTYTGATSISAGNLKVIGSLAGSALTVANGATLSGTGTVGAVTVNSGGTLSPGASIGTLTIDGDLTLDPGSTTLIEISPTASDLIHVTGTATLTNGALSIQPQSGFYGFSSSYTILTTDTPLATQFASSSVSNSNFIPNLTYLSNSVLLTVDVIQPFLDFPYRNSNTRSVGENLDALGLAGILTDDPDLVAVVDSLKGFSFDAINDALDQMHPAQIGAFAELESAVGAQILSIYHRKQILGCGCSRNSHAWIEPFGNWLVEKSRGMQTGFRSHTWGLALGVDTDVTEEWALGIGGVYCDSHLDWHLDRGSGDTHGLYGAFYTDIMTGRWYLGSSFLAGMDWYDISRRIHFSTVDRHAVSHFDALDLMWQLSSAYFFGAPSCHLFPFANVDALYLKMDSFQEREAQSLNLTVDSYSSLTLRTESGIGLEVLDKNYDETICISPLFALGWTMNWPAKRDHFVSTFKGQNISFKTTGWNDLRQLLSLRFGINFYYHCFTLSGEYVGEFSTDKDSSYDNQRGNVRFDFKF